MLGQRRPTLRPNLGVCTGVERVVGAILVAGEDVGGSAVVGRARAVVRTFGVPGGQKASLVAGVPKIARCSFEIGCVRFDLFPGPQVEQQQQKCEADHRNLLERDRDQFEPLAGLPFPAAKFPNTIFVSPFARFVPGVGDEGIDEETKGHKEDETVDEEVVLIHKRLAEVEAIV